MRLDFNKLLQTLLQFKHDVPPHSSNLPIGQVVEFTALRTGSLVAGKISRVYKRGHKTTVAFIAAHAIPPDSEIESRCGVPLSWKVHYCIALSLGYGITAVLVGKRSK